MKLDGGADRRHATRLRDLIATTSAPIVLLACTELPLLDVEVQGRELVDVTAALAETLVDRA